MKCKSFNLQYHAAILSYKKAYNFAIKNLGPEDGITENLKNVYENARKELDPSFKKSSPKKDDLQIGEEEKDDN